MNLEIINDAVICKEYLIRILFATFLSALIGLEREIHGRAAGARTNILIGTGSALFMILSLVVASYGKSIAGSNGAVPDPGRIAAQVVTGIGFLGAGAIIKYGVNVKGLTTAASMWIIASIGMACGIGEFFLAASVTLITLIILVLFSFLNKKIPSHSYRTLQITLKSEHDFPSIIATIKANAKIQAIDFDYDYDASRFTIDLSLRLFFSGTTDRLFKDFVNKIKDINDDIIKIKWHR